ncbi:MAG: cation:proton antiporter, partial [Chromatocurvus sp.]
VLAGPSALNIVVSHDNIDLMAELGIALLLFLVGLKLDISLIRSLGLVALATGLGQVLFTSFFGFLIALALGLEPVAALYVAVALTFSSTIIIVKLLSDKREVDSLHGRIAIGFLIVQDLVVVIAMMALSSFGVASGDSGAKDLLGVLLSGIGMLAAVLLFIRYAATPLMKRVAGSNELMVIFAIAWAALLAAAGHYLGFSKELGGLLAGVSLATTPYRDALAARLSSLRDFLLLFFFVALGSSLDLGLLGAQVVPALVLSAFVLIGNPLIVLAIMGFLGYRKRTGFLAGLTVAQISEFSVIFMAIGVALGHVSNDALGLVTLVGLISIALSVYMITYSYELFRLLEPLLGVFERRKPKRESAIPENAIPRDIDVILFGLGRYGSAIVRQLREAGLRVFAVDFNPDVVQRGRALGINAVYGDAADPEVIDALPIEGVKWVVSALPQHDT